MSHIWSWVSLINPIEARKIQLTQTAGLWGRLATCGGLLTRLPKLAKRVVQRRVPTGVQDAILPHNVP